MLWGLGAVIALIGSSFWWADYTDNPALDDVLNGNNDEKEGPPLPGGGYYSPSPDPGDVPINFGPWKSRSEDEWIIGLIILAILLKFKPWK